MDDSDAGIAKMRELAQSEYNSGKRIAEIDQLFADEAAVTKPEYLNQLHLAQILFYTGNGFYQQAADLSTTIDPESLPLAQKAFSMMQCIAPILDSKTRLRLVNILPLVMKFR